MPEFSGPARPTYRGTSVALAGDAMTPTAHAASHGVGGTDILATVFTYNKKTTLKSGFSSNDNQLGSVFMQDSFVARSPTVILKVGLTGMMVGNARAAFTMFVGGADIANPLTDQFGNAITGTDAFGAAKSTPYPCGAVSSDIQSPILRDIVLTGLQVGHTYNWQLVFGIVGSSNNWASRYDVASWTAGTALITDPYITVDDVGLPVFGNGIPPWSFVGYVSPGGNSFRLTANPGGTQRNFNGNINGASNATPIIITAGSAHGLQSGDWVIITGVTGNTAANGLWQITVTNFTGFSLNGSVGNGAYVSGGTVTTDQLPTVTQANQVLRIGYGYKVNDVPLRSGVSGKQDKGYLINNANTVLSISSVTAANPAVVTTSVPHGLQSGMRVHIANSGVAAVNGPWVVTVLTTTTFSIPLNNVTAVGAVGTVTITAGAQVIPVKLGGRGGGYYGLGDPYGRPQPYGSTFYNPVPGTALHTGQCGAFTPDGTLFVCGGFGNNMVHIISPDDQVLGGTPYGRDMVITSQLVAGLASTFDMAIDNSFVYLVDFWNLKIFKMALTAPYTVTSSAAIPSAPNCITLSPDGATLYVGMSNGQIQTITAATLALGAAITFVGQQAGAGIFGTPGAIGATTVISCLAFSDPDVMWGVAKTATYGTLFTYRVHTAAKGAFPLSYANPTKFAISSWANRTDAATVTSGSSTILDASVTQNDQYRYVSGTGIPLGSYVGAVVPGVSFTLVNGQYPGAAAVNATANGTAITIQGASNCWVGYQASASTGNPTGRTDTATWTAASPVITDGSITAADQGLLVTAVNFPGPCWVGTVIANTSFRLSAHPTIQVDVNPTGPGTNAAITIAPIGKVTQQWLSGQFFGSEFVRVGAYNLAKQWYSDIQYVRITNDGQIYLASGLGDAMFQWPGGSFSVTPGPSFMNDYCEMVVFGGN